MNIDNAEMDIDGPEMDIDDTNIDTELVNLEPEDELTLEEARIMRDALDDAIQTKNVGASSGALARLAVNSAIKYGPTAVRVASRLWRGRRRRRFFGSRRRRRRRRRRS